MRQIWREKILKYEYRKYENLCGIDIRVTNIRVFRDTVQADVKIVDDDVETMYRGCSYGKEYI